MDLGQDEGRLLERLLWADATLFVLELSTLSIALNATANVFKGVSAVCVDSSASSSGKISFARRRSICNAEASTQGLIITKEINITLESVIMMMRRQGTSICFADAQGYKLLDTAELRLVPLFPHDRTYGSPLVESVDDDEFLVATGGEKHDGLGVYLSMTGDPASRGTLAFPSYPNSFGEETDGANLDYDLISRS